MKTEKIIKRLGKAVKDHQVCRITLVHGDGEEHMYIPLAMSDNLYIAVKNGDLDANGYKIRKIEDIEKIKVEDSYGQKKLLDDRISKEIVEMNIDSWQSIMSTLEKIHCAVVVESEKLPEVDGRYAVGNIEKVGRKNLAMFYYGPDSIWTGKKWKIPYDDITCVTIGSRYTEVLKKYVPEQNSISEEEAKAFEAAEIAELKADKVKVVSDKKKEKPESDEKKDKDKKKSAKDKAKDKIKKIASKL